MAQFPPTLQFLNLKWNCSFTCLYRTLGNFGNKLSDFFEGQFFVFFLVLKIDLLLKCFDFSFLKSAPIKIDFFKIFFFACVWIRSWQQATQCQACCNPTKCKSGCRQLLYYESTNVYEGSNSVQTLYINQYFSSELTFCAHKLPSCKLCAVKTNKR